MIFVIQLTLPDKTGYSKVKKKLILSDNLWLSLLLEVLVQPKDYL